MLDITEQQRCRPDIISVVATPVGLVGVEVDVFSTHEIGAPSVVSDVVNLVLHLTNTMLNDGLGDTTLASNLGVGERGEVLNIGVIRSLEVGVRE